MPDSSQPTRLRVRERGRARRRLRHLRQARELQLRDAGGFMYELYRFGEQRDALVRDKLEALIATDKEIRSLEALLGVASPVTVIRQPGVGGTCASCGAFHATGPKFCAHCGAELSVAEEPGEPDEPAAPEPEGELTVARQADEEPTAVEAPAPNGAGHAVEAEWRDPQPASSANGDAPAPQDEAEPEAADPDTGEVAAVGPGGRSGTER